MKRNSIIIVCLAAVVFVLLWRCTIETAYGPTPYTVEKKVSPGADQFLDSLQKATSLQDSLQKAASLQDNLRQDYVAMKFGMFLHFNMSTYDRCCCPGCYSVSGEWGTPNVDPNLFRPGRLNCGQWADVAKSAKCKYMVLVAKHHDGFCLWNSRYTVYDVGSTSWGGGNRDVIREFVDSARAEGLKVGLYYSIWDKTNGSSLRFIKGQLAELLTKYGEIACIWFDGWNWMVPYGFVPYDTVRNLIKRLQPKCLIVNNSYVFTTGNTDIIEYEMPLYGPPHIGNALPSEGCQTIRTDKCWFWHPGNECSLLPAQTIVDEMNVNNSRNAAYLLDLTPDASGLLPQCQADRMSEVGLLQ